MQWCDLGYVGFLRRYVAAYLRSRLRGYSAQGRVPTHPVRDRGRLGRATAGGNVVLSFPCSPLVRGSPMSRSVARPAAARVARPPRGAAPPCDRCGPRHLALVGRGRRSHPSRCGVVGVGLGVAHTAAYRSRSSPRSRLQRPRLVDPGDRHRQRGVALRASGRRGVTPGVYRVPADARVIDVIDAAGGLAGGADADRLALAAKVSDGERVTCPRSARRCRALPPVRPSAHDDGPVDLNTAVEQRARRTPGRRTCHRLRQS